MAKTIKSKRLQKKAQRTTTEQRKSSTQKSTVAIESITRIKNLLKPWELSRSERYKTYQSMRRDDAVWSSLSLRTKLVQATQYSGKFKYDTNNENSVAVVKFLEHCMKDMSFQTPRSIAGDACEMIFNSYAPFEVVTKEGEGAWAGYHTLSKLSYINPLTIDSLKPYKTVNGGNAITEWYQLNSAFLNSDGTNKTTGEKTKLNNNYGSQPIDARKVVYTTYSNSISNPISDSDFDAAYDPWREKGLINDFLIMGVQKDMAGVPILEVPQQLLDEASVIGSDAWNTVEALKLQMGNLHAGDQSFMIMPSDTHNEAGSGAKLYGITFKGIDGGGKNFDLEKLIDQKNRAIHKALGSSNLSNAETGAASYNSLEGSSNIQLHVVKADSRIVDEMWNKQVFPLLLRLNGWVVASADMPIWEHGEAAPISLDESGKYINRVARLLPAVPEVCNKLLEHANISYRVDDNATPDDIRKMLFTFVDDSKVGEGEGSSGTGDSQQGGSASDTNDENAS